LIDVFYILIVSIARFRLKINSKVLVLPGLCACIEDFKNKEKYSYIMYLKTIIYIQNLENKIKSIKLIKKKIK